MRLPLLLQIPCIDNFLEGGVNRLVKPKGNLLSTQTVSTTTTTITTPHPSPRHQHHESPMHVVLWALGASVTILLLGGAIATYHHSASVARRQADEQREQRFLADAFDLEQLRGGPARRAYFLDLLQYRHCEYLLEFFTHLFRSIV